jgi:hypothetical protein
MAAFVLVVLSMVAHVQVRAPVDGWAVGANAIYN